LTPSVVPFYVVWILLAWVAYQMVVITFLEIHDCCIAEDSKCLYITLISLVHLMIETDFTNTCT